MIRSTTRSEGDRLKEAVSESDHALGNRAAPVTIVEYGDYDCPLSARAHNWLKVLRREFGEQLRFVFRQFPLTGLHPHAALAANAAELAAERELFWQMHELLMKSKRPLKTQVILGYMDLLGLKELGVQARDRAQERIDRDVQSGLESGVVSTPCFFLNGLRIPGPVSEEILRNHIHHTLRGLPISA